MKCTPSLAARWMPRLAFWAATLVAGAGLAEIRATAAANDRGSWAVAQEADDEPRPDEESESQSPPESMELGDDRPPSDGMLRRFWSRWRTVDEHERNHRIVREAFREVVRDAIPATVQVISKDRRIAFGTVIDPQGFVITKASELKGDVACRLADGRVLPAQIATISEELDIAVLHVDAVDLTPVRWREGEAPASGSWLASVGTSDVPNAVGVVSAAPRAIPSPRPVLGVMLETVASGARITGVMPESPAQEAGLATDDVVVELNGKAVADQESLVSSIRGMRPGDRVEVVVRRGEERKTFSITLIEINSLAQGKRISFQNSLGGPLSTRRWGFPSVLQHDTVLRPNECGGPIVDLDGRVVGINIARAGRVASYALPAAALEPLLEEIRSGKFGPSGELNEKQIAQRVHQLRQVAKDLGDRFHSLERELVEKRQSAGEQPPPGGDAGAELARLESAAAEAKRQLDETLAELRRYENAGAVSTSATP